MPEPTILILSTSPLCRNPRVLKEATTLGNAGYEVTVLTIANSARFEAIDRNLLRGLPFKRMVIDYTSRDPGTRVADFVQRVITRLSRQVCKTLGLELAESLGPARQLLRQALDHPAELTIAHTEIPIWASCHLIRNHRRVAVDFEDWHSEDLLPADRRSRPLRLLRKAEAFALKHAAYASATSTRMSEALVAAFNCSAPLVIRNTFPLQARIRPDRPESQPSAFIWFSQTIGPGRGLEAFLSAWSRMHQPSTVHLLGDARPGYETELRARVPADRRQQIHFIPLVTPDELPVKLTEFDIGLALESRSPLSRNITITNKILQYMNAGLAVVATETDGQREVMDAAPGAGVMVDLEKTAELTALLDQMVGDTAGIRSMQMQARRAAKTMFSWEHDSVRLLQAVGNVIGPPDRQAPPG